MEMEVLLTPLAAHAPCGDDLSFSSEFDTINEMRRADDATLNQGEWVTSLKVADWPGVARTCETLLGTRTKDLRLAMWLTEAWALTQGYSGLARGLQVCTELCTRYWAPLHPIADDGDHEQRIGNMRWLLQRVVSLATSLPVAQARKGTVYSLHDLTLARQYATLLEREPDEAARSASDKLTLEQFQRALRDTPAETLQGTLTAARQCEAALLAWQVVVDAELGADGPSFVAAKEALSQAVHDIERLAREVGALHDTVGAATVAVAAVATAGTALPSTGPQGAPVAAGPLQTRAQALQQLRDVAHFFRRTEPHSPVAYLAEKAVKWGEMPLHEWLSQVIKDQGGHVSPGRVAGPGQARARSRLSGWHAARSRRGVPA
jgi:type VI secretion system protein ImpA